MTRPTRGDVEAWDRRNIRALIDDTEAAGLLGSADADRARGHLDAGECRNALSLVLRWRERAGRA